MHSIKRFTRLTALAAVLALILAACGGDDTTDTTQVAEETTETTAAMEEEMTETTAAMEEEMTETTAAMEEEMTETTAAMEEEMTETTEDMEDMGGLTAMNTGSACSAVPADGEGSFEGMTDDPAATAASNNPVLSTLVTAVGEAELVDTLNGEGPFTIFAPTNDAFAAIPEEDLNAILADQEQLTSILTYHVVAGESLDMQALVDAGTVTTVNGADLTIGTSGDTISVNGEAAVVCGNVQTANATVHIIDSVLVPSS